MQGVLEAGLASPTIPEDTTAVYCTAQGAVFLYSRLTWVVHALAPLLQHMRCMAVFVVPCILSLRCAE